MTRECHIAVIDMSGNIDGIEMRFMGAVLLV